MPRSQALERVDREILAEKAATLGRAGERVEAALAAALALWQACETAASAEEATRLGAEYAAARRRALEARRVLVIQREAVGLRDHRLVELCFPAPPRRPVPVTEDGTRA